MKPSRPTITQTPSLRVRPTQGPALTNSHHNPNLYQTLTIRRLDLFTAICRTQNTHDLEKNRFLVLNFCLTSRSQRQKYVDPQNFKILEYKNFIKFTREGISTVAINLQHLLQVHAKAISKTADNGKYRIYLNDAWVVTLLGMFLFIIPAENPFRGACSLKPPPGCFDLLIFCYDSLHHILINCI